MTFTRLKAGDVKHFKILHLKPDLFNVALQTGRNLTPHVDKNAWLLLA